ncbi:hypothetical protein D9M73_164920 [compost metagenome]
MIASTMSAPLKSGWLRTTRLLLLMRAISTRVGTWQPSIGQICWKIGRYWSWRAISSKWNHTYWNASRPAASRVRKPHSRRLPQLGAGFSQPSCSGSSTTSTSGSLREGRSGLPARPGSKRSPGSGSTGSSSCADRRSASGSSSRALRPVSGVSSSLIRSGSLNAGWSSRSAARCTGGSPSMSRSRLLPRVGSVRSPGAGSRSSSKGSGSSSTGVGSAGSCGA